MSTEASPPQAPAGSYAEGNAVLLHICCGPCATATQEFWVHQGYEPVGLFYNPNVQPLMEYRRRLDGARRLASARSFRLLEDLAYDPVRWFSLVGLREGRERCRACIAMRLDVSADHAKRNGFSAFTTSLAISPWQDHEAIQEGGHAAADLHGVPFLYEDLRSLYRDSRRQARELDLYRQQYCGCVVSEWERYRDT